MNNKEFEDLLAFTLRGGDCPSQERKLALKKRLEDKKMKTNKKPAVRILLIAAAIVLLVSATATAAYLLLTPKDVAEMMGHQEVIDAFQSPGAVLIDEKQTIGGYEFTLMGMAPGKSLVMIDGVPQDNATYAVIAITKTDGTPMPEFTSEEYRAFYSTAYVQGVIPWQNLLAFGQSTMVLDGVQYIVVDCAELEPFADSTVYLAVSENYPFNQDAYNYNMETGIITRVEDYDGANALFTLPLDPSKADPARAGEILNTTAPEVFTAAVYDVNPAPEGESLSPDNPGRLMLHDLTKEQRQAYINYYNEIPLEDCILMEDSVKALTPGEDGSYSYEYNGSFSALDTDQFSGDPNVVRAGWSGGAVGDPVEITVFTIDENGTVRGMVYLAPGFIPE